MRAMPCQTIQTRFAYMMSGSPSSTIRPRPASALFINCVPESPSSALFLKSGLTPALINGVRSLIRSFSLSRCLCACAWPC